MTPRRKAHLITLLGVIWVTTFPFVPYTYSPVAMLGGFLVLVILSRRAVCRRCGTPMHTRRVRLFGSDWMFAWPWAPRVCALCAQRLDTELPSAEEWEPRGERWSSSKWATALLICSFSSLVGGVIAWLDGLPVQGLLALFAGLVWGAAGIALRARAVGRRR